MSSQLLFSKEHIWVRREGEEAVLGMTDHAQEQLGDMIMLLLPDPGTLLNRGDRLVCGDSVPSGTLESFYFELMTPVSGEIVGVNEEIEDSPELINDDPYEKGWLARIYLFDEGEYSKLLDEQGHATYLASGGSSPPKATKDRSP